MSEFFRGIFCTPKYRVKEERYQDKVTFVVQQYDLLDNFRWVSLDTTFSLDAGKKLIEKKKQEQKIEKQLLQKKTPIKTIYHYD